MSTNETSQEAESGSTDCSWSPITIDWLKSIGFTSGGEIGKTVVQGEWRIWPTPGGQPHGRWQIRWNLSCVNRHRRFDCRKDLVDLWRMLGVPWCPCDCGKPAVLNEITGVNCGCCETCMPF